MRRRTGWLSVVFGLSLSTCLFDGDETRGLPCTNDDQCGIGITCTEGVCGGAAEQTCALDMPVCASDLVVRECFDGQPLDVHCDDVCQSNGLGRALACAASPPGAAAGCYCDEASTFCDAEGVYECWDDDDARVCDQGAWVNLDCDWVCGQDGGGSGNSCGPNMQGELVCFCDEPCLEAEQFCGSSDALRVCQAGTWVDQPCADANCESGVSLGCGFLKAIGDETCICAA